MFCRIVSYIIKIIHLKPFFHLLYLFPFLWIFTQCTIQKRLYTHGYHIEHRAKVRSGSTDFSDSVYSQSLIVQNTDFIPEEVRSDNSEETEHVTDTTVVIANNGIKRDTVFVYTATKRDLDQQKKRNRLVGVGIPMIGLGTIAAGSLSSATAAGASLSSILFLGVIGWLCALLAAILLIVFLVFLCIPVANAPDPNPNQEQQLKNSLSKGERSALTAIFIVIGIIGLAFLFTNINK